MTAALEPALAAAYVHELSADVRAVVVLDRAGARLAGPEALAGPAAAVAALTDGGIVRLDDGVVWVAKGPELTLVAAAGDTAITGPTARDIGAASGSTSPVEAVENPSAELKAAVRDVIMSTSTG